MGRFPGELAVDDLLESGDRLGADEHAAVDEEGGSSRGAETSAFLNVAGNGRLIFAAVEAFLEVFSVELDRKSVV